MPSYRSVSRLLASILNHQSPAHILNPSHKPYPLAEMSEACTTRTKSVKQILRHFWLLLVAVVMDFVVASLITDMLMIAYQYI